jgi:hypothetical protein
MSTTKGNHTLLLGAAMLSLALPGCGSTHDGAEPLSLRAADDFGASSDSGSESSDGFEEPEGADEYEPLLEDLPFVDPLEHPRVLLELLSEPRSSGENVAVHVALDPPLDPSLSESLVRIVGGEDDPMLAFKTDALVELGQLDESPGPEYFTLFLTFDEAAGIDDRLAIETELASCEQPTEARLQFEGRSPVAITTGIPFDGEGFRAGNPVPVGPCPTQPTSTRARWDESLLITDLRVVRDPTRTRDACGDSGNPTEHPNGNPNGVHNGSPYGNPNGVWTFKHLMTQMAMGSNITSTPNTVAQKTHDFVVDWLEQWLDNYTVFGDSVSARTQIFNDVLQPWATKSNVNAWTYTDASGRSRLGLSGPLDLDFAPFQLAAIVNRADLASGGSYGSNLGGSLAELRFVFGVQNLTTCTVLPFSVIFEYGVPGTNNCFASRSWARRWVDLNFQSPLAVQFAPSWRTKLEGMTQDVVLYGKGAPNRGNLNMINQIRTNEVALAGVGGTPWELREFTLTTESVQPGNPLQMSIDTPATGFLRPHSVAMTPDDGMYASSNDPSIYWFVQSQVQPSVSTTGGCSSNYPMPAKIVPPWTQTAQWFRGANSLISPTEWFANVSPNAIGKCARREFSLNTCNGCHSGETGTSFFHVDPTVSPAALSGFLIGTSIFDPQFGSPTTWTYMDLDRRFTRLYQMACGHCGDARSKRPDMLQDIANAVEAVPVDVSDPSTLPFAVGPIVEISQVEMLLGWSDDGVFDDGEEPSSVEPEQLGRPAPSFVH